MHCGERIKELLHKKGISQKELSLIIKKPESTISGWMQRYDIPLSNIRKVCKAMNIELFEFFLPEENLQKAMNISADVLRFCKLVDLLPQNMRIKFLTHIESGLALIE